MGGGCSGSGSVKEKERVRATILSESPAVTVQTCPGRYLSIPVGSYGTRNIV